MSVKSKMWNKKFMLSTALFGMSLSMFGNGNATTLGQFAFFRFLFGLFAAGINAPIYQLIAANFPPKYRSTANAIENAGYYIGGALASLMCLVIKAFGWRAMYFTAGTFGSILFILNILIIKNPVLKTESKP